VSDYLDDDLSGHAADDSDDFLDRPDWSPPQMEEPIEVREPEVFDEPKPVLNEPDAPAEVESSAAPTLSVEERIAMAARGTEAAGAEPNAPDPTAFSQATLLQIATHDPVRYADLRKQGHKLNPTHFGPDRDR
jgi:hypothetical protein